MFGRGGPFGSMFGNDPFFSDPFSHMNSMMNSMLSDPFFGGPVVRPPVVQHQHSRGRQPVIEEVDGADHPERAVRAQDEPIVEEPDEDGSPHDRAAQRQRRHSPTRAAAAPTYSDPFGSLLGALTTGAGGGGSSFMFSSSTYSSMGPGGVTYQASSTTRVGPGGVRETQAVVRDGRSGTESVTISRGLGDGRQRTLVRRRDAAGREQQVEDLQGIAEHEADLFDDQWRHHAERSLPGGGASRGSSAQRPLALPSTTGAGAGSGGGPAFGAQPYDAGARGPAAATASSLRSSYPAHGTAGPTRQHSAGGSQYAPSTSGRSTASGVSPSPGLGGGAGAGAGAGYGGAGPHGAYSRGPSASQYGSGGRAGGSGAGSTGYRVGPQLDQYAARQASPPAGHAGGYSAYGGASYAPAPASQGQQRYRH